MGESVGILLGGDEDGAADGTVVGVGVGDDGWKVGVDDGATVGL